MKVLEERRESLNSDLVTLTKQVQQVVYKRDSELGKKNGHVSFYLTNSGLIQLGLNGLNKSTRKNSDTFNCS